MSTTLHFKDIGIRKSEFVAKIHSFPLEKQLFLQGGYYGLFVFILPSVMISICSILSVLLPPPSTHPLLIYSTLDLSPTDLNKIFFTKIKIFHV